MAGRKKAYTHDELYDRSELGYTQPVQSGGRRDVESQ